MFNFKTINKQNLRRGALMLGVFFLLVLAFFLLRHYVNIKKDLFNLKISKGYISLKKINYKFYKKGRIAYEIFAKSLDYYSPKNNIIKLVDVRAYIYGHNGKPKYLITGESGRLNISTKNIKVSGSVVIKDFKGSYMKTGLIYYFASKDMIVSPAKVKIKGKGYLVSGNDLIFYIKKDLFMLQQRVNFKSNGRNG